MDVLNQVFASIGDGLNAFLANQYVVLAARAIAVYVVLLWLACAYWAFRDLQSRTAKPIGPYLAAIVIILFTPILFPFGVLLYRLVRPGETVAEANERAIAEEAMLREIEAQPHCARCSRRVDTEWIVCPTCRNQLRRVCPSCGRKLELDWLVCAWCGRDAALPAPAVAEVPLQAPERRPRRRATAAGSAAVSAPDGVLTAVRSPLDLAADGGTPPAGSAGG